MTSILVIKTRFWHWYCPLPPLAGSLGPLGGDWQNIGKQLSPRLHPLTTAAAITHYGLLASTHNHWLIIDQEQMVVAILRIIVRSTSRCVCPTISETRVHVDSSEKTWDDRRGCTPRVVRNRSQARKWTVWVPVFASSGTDSVHSDSSRFIHVVCLQPTRFEPVNHVYEVAE